MKKIAVFLLTPALILATTFTFGPANVQANSAILIVSTSFANFNYIQGGTVPADQQATISNNSTTETINYNISVPDQPAWLNTTYTTSTLSLAPLQTAGIGISIDPDGLAAGTYTTTINFTGDFANSPTSIKVTLTVSASSSGTISNYNQVKNTNLSDGKLNQEYVGYADFSNVSFDKVTVSGLPEGMYYWNENLSTGDLRFNFAGKPAYDGTYNVSLAFNRNNTTVIRTVQLRINTVSGIGGKSTVISGGEIVDVYGTIYKIENGIRRPFTNAATFLVHRLKFSDARPATAQERALPSGSYVEVPDGVLVNDRGTIYITEFGKKRGFTNFQAFAGLGYKLSNVVNITDTAAIPTGDVISTESRRHPRGTLVVHNGTVYFMGKDYRYPHPSPEVFLSWGNRWEDLVPANNYDLQVPVGPVVEKKN